MSCSTLKRQASKASSVPMSTATARGSGSACGAMRMRNTARTPITAGPTPRMAAFVHASIRTRSNTGSSTNMIRKDGKKLAVAANHRASYSRHFIADIGRHHQHRSRCELTERQPMHELLRREPVIVLHHLFLDQGNHRQAAAESQCSDLQKKC